METSIFPKLSESLRHEKRARTNPLPRDRPIEWKAIDLFPIQCSFSVARRSRERRARRCRSPVLQRECIKLEGKAGDARFCATLARARWINNPDRKERIASRSRYCSTTCDLESRQRPAGSATIGIYKKGERAKRGVVPPRCWSSGRFLVRTEEEKKRERERERESVCACVCKNVQTKKLCTCVRYDSRNGLSGVSNRYDLSTCARACAGASPLVFTERRCRERGLFMPFVYERADSSREREKEREKEREREREREREGEGEE